MSNLRIKNKRLKRELEDLKKYLMPTKKIVYSSANGKIVTLRTSLALTTEDLEYIPECTEQVKRALLEEVKDFVKIEFIPFNPNTDRGLPFPSLYADLKVVKGD